MLISEIVDNIAQHFGRPFDIPFKSRIKSEVISIRAEIIKQHFNKYGTYPESLVTQIHSISTFSTDIGENNIVSIGKDIKRTVLKVPSPIRMSTSSNNFIYVGTIDGKRSFGYIEPESYEDLKEDRFQKRTIRYSYINGYIYIYGSCPKNIRVRGIFADPYKVAILNNETEESCPQSLEIPEDFVNLIEKMTIDIIQRGFIKPDQEEEIRVQEDDK